MHKNMQTRKVKFLLRNLQFYGKGGILCVTVESQNSFVVFAELGESRSIRQTSCNLKTSQPKHFQIIINIHHYSKRQLTHMLRPRSHFCRSNAVSSLLLLLCQMAALILLSSVAANCYELSDCWVQSNDQLLLNPKYQKSITASASDNFS